MGTEQIPVSISEFPAQLKELRGKYGVTQKQLAEQANVSQQTISAIESGRMDPSLKIMAAIAMVLGVVLLVGAFSAMKTAR